MLLGEVGESSGKRPENTDEYACFLLIYYPLNLFGVVFFNKMQKQCIRLQLI